VYFEPIAATGEFIKRSSYARAGDPLYIAGRCYEELGDFVNALNCYSRFVKNPHEVIFAENIVDAEQRMALLAPKIEKNRPALNWKVGMFWEGVQGWYLRSIPGKNMPEGWVFSEVFFKVTDEQNVGKVTCFTLQIYNANAARVSIKQPLETATFPQLDQFRYCTIKINKNTMTPMEISYNSQRMEGGSDALYYSPEFPSRNLRLSTNNGIIPYASHVGFLPPDASIVFASPFSSQLPDCISKGLTTIPSKMIIGKKETDCTKTTLKLDLDLTASSVLNLVPTITTDIRKINSILIMDYAQEQYWSPEYPWWTRVVKLRPEHQAPSPDFGRYSSLFVLTSVQGKPVDVSTGLEGRYADMKTLREAFKDYEKKCEFKKYPSQEVADIFDLYLLPNNSLTKPDQYDGETLRARRDAAIAYFSDMQKQSEDSDYTYSNCVFFRYAILSDMEIIKLADKYLQTSPPEKKGVRNFYLYALGRFPSEESYKILLKHIELCEKENYSEQELGTTIMIAASQNIDAIIPLMLERFKKTRKQVYYNNLIQGLMRRLSNQVRIENANTIMPDTPQSVIDKCVKAVEDYCKKNNIK
jgi:hypothetical protein